MPRFWVTVMETTSVKYERILVEADGKEAAAEQGEEARGQGFVTGTGECVDGVSFEVEAVSDNDDDAHEALLPDGTRCPWDERLRIVGAHRVPKKVGDPELHTGIHDPHRFPEREAK